MSNLINFTQKRIYANKPSANNHGQYNYGRVTADGPFTNLGDSQSTSLQLYTRVYPHTNTNKNNNTQIYNI